VCHGGVLKTLHLVGIFSSMLSRWKRVVFPRSLDSYELGVEAQAVNKSVLDPGATVCTCLRLA